MSQATTGTINPNTTSGTALATLLSDAHGALISTHLGGTKPAYAVEGTIWGKNATSNLVFYGVDAGGASIPLFQIDATNHWAKMLLDADEDSHLNYTADDVLRATMGGTAVIDFTATGLKSLLSTFPLFDSNGKKVLDLESVGESGANFLTVVNAATGNAVSLAPKGTDANISVELAGKGSGLWKLSGGGGLLDRNLSATLGAGFPITAHDYGGGSPVSSGTVTVDFTKTGLAYYTNGGAHTLAADSVDGLQIILVTNNGSAGLITLSGITLTPNSDELTTTDTEAFMILVMRINGTSYAHQVALQ
jgi:hypothetical protein